MYRTIIIAALAWQAERDDNRQVTGGAGKGRRHKVCVWERVRVSESVQQAGVGVCTGTGEVMVI